MLDVLVVGCGPAGVAAALQLHSQALSVGVAALPTSSISEALAPLAYYGIDSLSGQELFQKGLLQLKAADIPFWEQQVTGLAPCPGGFAIHGKTPLQARCVLLATGTPKKSPLPEFLQAATRLHLRAEEDGFLYRNRVVGVIGHGPYAQSQAALLARTARTVTLFTNNQQPEVSPLWMPHQLAAITLVEEQDHLQHISLQNGTQLILDGLFLADRVATAADLCAGVKAKTQALLPITDAHGMCSLPGLFAAGSCTGKCSTLQEQVYDGYRVGCSIGSFLKK